jgi:hypothetical protein
MLPRLDDDQRKEKRLAIQSDMDGETIDADGCPHAYGPRELIRSIICQCRLSGNYWGIVTSDNGRPFSRKGETRRCGPGLILFQPQPILFPEFGKHQAGII